MASGRRAPDEAWINAFWSYLANSKGLFGGGKTAGGLMRQISYGNSSGPGTPMAEVARRCGRWPLLPCVVSNRQSQVLRRLRQEAPPLYFRDGSLQDSDQFREALASIGVRVVDLRFLPAQSDRLFGPEASPSGADGAHSLGLLGTGTRSLDPFVRHVSAIGILAAIYQCVGALIA